MLIPGDVEIPARREELLSATRLVAAGATLLGALLLVLSAAFAPAWVLQWLVVIVALAATGGAILANRTHPLERARRAWGALAVGMALYTVGLLLLPLGGDSRPGIADPANLLRLGLYAGFAVALFHLFRRPADSENRISISLDAAILSCAIGALVVEIVFNGIAPIGEAGEALLVFPLLDLLAIMVLILIAAPTRGRVGNSFLMMKTGFLALAVADIVYATPPVGELRAAAVAWPLGLALLSLAAGFNLSMRNIRGLRGTWLYAIGVGSVVVCLAVLLADALGDRDPYVLSLATAGLCLGMARFVTMARENYRLGRDTDGIIAAAGEGIYRIDLDGDVTYINPSALEMLGFDEEQMLGNSAHRLVHHTRENGSEYPPEDCPVCRTIRDGVTHRVSGEVYWRADGSSFPVDYTSAPVRHGGKTVGAVVVFDDVTYHRELEQQMLHQATHDNLTGIFNRRQLEDEVAAQLRYAGQYGHAGALLLIDLDSFTLVNDSLGHTTGDAVLGEVADAIVNRIGDTDVAARVGGDEFGVLLREATAEKAAEVGARLLDAIARIGSAPLGASVGIATFGGAAERRSAQDLLTRADSAVYEAKEGGGGKIVQAGAEAGRHVTWVEQIREALDRDRMAIHVQPIVRADSGELVREELLVRMLDAEGEAIPPDRFLPTAERFGLIAEIDLYVLNHAIEMARRGRRVAVNVSGRTLPDPRVLARVRSAVAEGVDAGLLSFEITETAAVANMGEARRFAVELRELGCCLALDDFGTGFSSFAYLRNIPTQVLKIDMAYIRDLTRNPADRYLVEAMVGVAAGLGQSTVAEGVEDEETLRVVRELGIDYAQGFHIGRPRPFEWVGQDAPSRVAGAS